MDPNNTLGRLFVRGWNSLVWGVPAVIGFFVISGFCIHLPYRDNQHLPIGRYYARRYIRILLPVFGFLILNSLAGNRQAVLGPDSVLYHSVLWSLFCEEIYYAIYPVTRWVRKTVGWSVLLPVTFALGAGTAAACFRAVDWPDCTLFASPTLLVPVWPFVTALILFPVWLLGCLLAEQSDRLPAVTSPWTI